MQVSSPEAEPLIETAADLLAKQLVNSYHPPTLCELVNDGLRAMAY